MHLHVPGASQASPHYIMLGSVVIALFAVKLQWCCVWHYSVLQPLSDATVSAAALDCFCLHSVLKPICPPLGYLRHLCCYQHGSRSASSAVIKASAVPAGAGNTP